jgi:hypothetical protein
MLNLWNKLFALPRVDAPDTTAAAATLVDLFEMHFEGELYETPAPHSAPAPVAEPSFDLTAAPASAK